MRLQSAFGRVSRPVFTALIGFTAVLFGDVTADAEPAVNIPIVADGVPHTVAIPPLAPHSSAVLYYYSTGRIAEAQHFEITGPANLRIQMAQANYYAFLEHALFFARDPFFWIAHWPYDYSLGHTVPEIVIPDFGGGSSDGGSSTGGGSGDPCDGIDPVVIPFLIDFCTEQTGHQCSREEACGVVNPPQDTPPAGEPPVTSNGGTVTFSSVILKDTCDPDRNRRYLVRLELFVDRLTPDLQSNGFTISVSARPDPYTDTMAFAVKEKGEGRVRGVLFLPHTTNQWGEGVRVDLWDGGTITWAKALKVTDYVYHRGQTLLRVAANSVMLGRYGTVTIGTPQKAYSVCVLLKKKRQNLNGYRR